MPSVTPGPNRLDEINNDITNVGERRKVDVEVGGVRQVDDVRDRRNGIIPRGSRCGREKFGIRRSSISTSHGFIEGDMPRSKDTSTGGGRVKIVGVLERIFETEEDARFSMNFVISGTIAARERKDLAAKDS